MHKTAIVFLSILSVFFISTALCYEVPTFNVERLNNEDPILSFFPVPNPKSVPLGSEFRYNYNSAYLEHNGKAALVVRAQNLKDPDGSIYEVGPSSLVYVEQEKQDEKVPLTFQKPTQARVILSSDDAPDIQNWGVEDPRVVYNPKDKTYYMFYTAVEDHTGPFYAHLALATCDTKGGLTPAQKECWKIQGEVVDRKDFKWSKSGGLLIRETGKHLLFWGDEQIRVAETDDLIHYKQTGKILINTRPDHFDSNLVESGPEPLQLSDGNYLYLYNSAQETKIPNLKNYTLTYNLGYVILDKDDPTKVLVRSEQPIFSPVLPWERCDLKTPDRDGMHYEKLGLTPDVVFIEGWKQTKKEGKLNEFIVYYQGCDAFMGAFRLTVTLPENKPETPSDNSFFLIFIGATAGASLGLLVLVVLLLVVGIVLVVGCAVFFDSPIWGGVYDKFMSGGEKPQFNAIN